MLSPGSKSMLQELSVGCDKADKGRGRGRGKGKIAWRRGSRRRQHGVSAAATPGPSGGVAAGLIDSGCVGVTLRARLPKALC